MRSGVARDNEPRLAARAVIPIFAVQSCGIFAQINVFKKTIQRVCALRIGSCQFRVAQIRKLSCVTLSAIWTMDSHLSLSVDLVERQHLFRQ